ncbi:SpoIIE family protein phosphatase [Leptospira adleri]|uniref:histidine kinase n=1 Tax=Leptospira adleri TaxID=2023186 RepID=A0A2M9YJT8_9LEPT|nr:SpoIIE family protein phosphatase [Leptospira adleri]PJZ51766.1 hypothetical protein CH380_18675 [Leptospira adleri]PJZ60347.1 hypothetical protein CH376_18950 [Leptospira adleri]
MVDNIFRLNYYSIGYVSATMFSAFLLVYLLSLRNKSKQTWLLIGFFFCTFIFNFGFLLRASVFSEGIAKPACFLIALYTCFSNLLLSSFVYSFPRDRTEKESRIVFLVLAIAGSIGYAYYISENIDSPIVYNFDTQLYEFQSPQSTAPMGILHFLTFLWILTVIVRKAIREELEFRIKEKIETKGLLRLHSPNANILRAFGQAILVHTIFSSIYVLYATKKIPFAYFQLLLTTAASLQLFIYTIAYLNNSPQPSTFMMKLVGVTLVSTLTILSAVSKISLQINESFFDEIRRLETKQLVKRIDQLNENEIPPNLLYIASFPRTQGLFLHNFNIEYKKPLSINENILFQSEMEELVRYIDQVDSNNFSETDLYRSYYHFDESSPQFSKRLYRVLETKNEERILLIRYVFKYGDRIYEVGYPFEIYLATVHFIAFKVLIAILISTLLILLLFPLFLNGGLIKPLITLLNGVKEVNRGKYNVRLPIQAEDEIGFLSRSFNNMVDSIRSSQEKLKKFADTLEEKVEERTSELQKSLDTVQKLKTKQDSDYYLTSLLIQPLSQNKSDSKNVLVEFLTEQKKKFQFKRWSSEIGGDLCVSSKITLRGRDYTAILNGDAMGKSMQGAGGALVLGSVFKAIVERSRYLDVMNQYPETWLKNAFIELHNIFTSFDGTMMASSFISLLEDQSGVIYYINAAHPLPVYYRQGVATFLPHRFQYRKLGMHINIETDLFINLFKLEANDVLVIASDGRDDILIEDENGENMNDNEEFFLQCVEAGNGNLKNIIEQIKNKGEIIDDISLVRVEYKLFNPTAEIKSEEFARIFDQSVQHFKRRNYEESISILESFINRNQDYKRNREILKQLTLAHFQTKNYVKALEAAVSYMEVAPEDSEVLFIMAECHRNEGNLKRAADLGERLRLRSPKDKRNTILLSEVYEALGDPKRAESLIAEVKYFERDERTFKG